MLGSELIYFVFVFRLQFRASEMGIAEGGFCLTRRSEVKNSSIEIVMGWTIHDKIITINDFIINSSKHFPNNILILIHTNANSLPIPQTRNLEVQWRKRKKKASWIENDLQVENGYHCYWDHFHSFDRRIKLNSQSHQRQKGYWLRYHFPLPPPQAYNAIRFIIRCWKLFIGIEQLSRDKIWYSWENLWRRITDIHVVCGQNFRQWELIVFLEYKCELIFRAEVCLLSSKEKPLHKLTFSCFGSKR